ncbi:bifunctional DNA primase/polymerase [Streptomyces sp. NPDC004546]|uniref:bifunctional DNA primase/polymerase n=1 Tax=Streptomyces sp. NPDC004546 TaxID=3154282 RepID=UPI0033AEF64E
MNARPHPAHNTAVAHALSAAHRGLAVIPLSRTKLPAVRSPHRAERRRIRCHGECGQVGHGIHDATTDPDAVRALFAAAPWATGYGIACGRAPHHLIGIDLDIKNDIDGIANFAALADEHGFKVPATITVATPSGGRHLWLRGPADRTIPNSVGRLAPGIDVRGNGGYLVGPGSTSNRGIYTLVPGTEHQALGDLPHRLLQLLTPPTPAPTMASPLPVAGRKALALVQFVLDASEGQRNDRLYWAACRAYETTDGPALADALIEAATRVGLPEPEARATVASAARRIARGAR